MEVRRGGYVLADQQTGIHVLAMWPGKPPVWAIGRVEAYLDGDDWKADVARCDEIVARAEERGLHPYTRQNQQTGVWLWNLIGEGDQHRAITYSTVKRVLGIDQGAAS